MLSGKILGVNIFITKNWSEFSILVEIENQCAQKFKEVGYRPERWGHSCESRFKKYLQQGNLYVATIDGIAAGFALVDQSKESFHLEELDIHPDYMRRGIASIIIRQIISDARAKNKKHITLRTFKTTPWSVKLYQKHGFKSCSDTLLARHDHLLNAELIAGLPMQDRISLCLYL